MQVFVFYDVTRNKNRKIFLPQNNKRYVESIINLLLNFVFYRIWGERKQILAIRSLAQGNILYRSSTCQKSLFFFIKPSFSSVSNTRL